MNGLLIIGMKRFIEIKLQLIKNVSQGIDLEKTALIQLDMLDFIFNRAGTLDVLIFAPCRKTP